VLYLRIIILSVKDDIPVDSDTLLVTDFMNIKIKSTQYFRCTYRDRLCVCVYEDECSYVYEYMCLYCVSKK
jgi:hypothetical protein